MKLNIDGLDLETAGPKLLSRLVEMAASARASDIHLQMAAGGAAEVRFRLDGVMAPGPSIPAPFAERVIGRIKYLARLKTYQESMPQDGRIEAASIGQTNDLRVSTYPTITGEKVVIRMFQRVELPDVGHLGLPKEAAELLARATRLTQGLILLTGPAGSGKTTTIYAALREILDHGNRHIITVEDPVEQIIPGVMQTEISEPRGLTFPVAAKHLLRQDPQVLVIGEIRDEETAETCVRAALTGHLVISTLHAGSCHGVWDRLASFCPDKAAAAQSIELIVNQRLLRQTCDGCRGEGCGACLETGYRGRIPLVEMFRPGPSARQEWREGRNQATQPGESLRARAKALVAAGRTTEKEVVRALGEEF